MKEGYRLLGDFIQPVDERNRDLRVDYLLGVSISKQFIPSIANIVGTDLSNYKIVRTGQFAYGPVTSRNGEKISIALLRDKDCIISSSYTVFEVVNKNELDSEYLMLWFSRPEFDRYARYMSHGSVREIFDWDELCKVELPVPSIDKQRSIVRAYQNITERIELKRRINDNLEAQTQALFDELFLRDGMPDCTLSEIANVNPTRTLSKGCIAKCYDKMIELSKRIKLIVDDKAKYTDWSTRDDIKANLQVDLILLLDEFDYPPVTIDDVYKEVLEQAENFKKYSE